MQKYWYLLLADSTISKYVKAYPEITFRGSRSFKDNLVHSHHYPKQMDPHACTGTFPCGRCHFCRFIRGGGCEITLSDEYDYRSCFLASCQSVGVVYIMLCDCGAFYVGKTKRQFFHWIRDHVRLVSKSKMETPISCHMGLFHAFDLSKMLFFLH